MDPWMALDEPPIERFLSIPPGCVRDKRDMKEIRGCMMGTATFSSQVSALNPPPLGERVWGLFGLRALGSFWTDSEVRV